MFSKEKISKYFPGLFKKEESSKAPMKHNFQFDYISKEEFFSKKDLLKQIKDGELSGVIVKNFFDREQLDEILAKYWENKTEKMQLPDNQGTTYPTVFAHVLHETGGAEEGINKYFNKCAAFRDEFGGNFGIDAAKLFQEAFEAISGGRPVKVPHGVHGEGIYPFATFRDLNPNTGEMTLHSGLHFYYTFPEFYKHLHTIVGDNNQLSYFTLLQKPEAGGELTIYDIVQDEIGKKIDDLQIEHKNGTLLHIEKNLPNMKLKLEDGDLLIFDGGTIWHRVEMVKGDKHRITLGGFMGFTKDEKEIYYWS